MCVLNCKSWHRTITSKGALLSKIYCRKTTACYSETLTNHAKNAWNERKGTFLEKVTEKSCNNQITHRRWDAEKPKSKRVSNDHLGIFVEKYVRQSVFSAIPMSHLTKIWIYIWKFCRKQILLGCVSTDLAVFCLKIILLYEVIFLSYLGGKTTTYVG